MEKLFRNYILRVTKVNRGDTPPFAAGYETIKIKPPFTIEFDVQRNFLGSPNHASIRIYNLSEQRRLLITKDPTDFDVRLSFELLAGYGKDLSKIAGGDIYHAWSVREGNNMVTTFEAYDAGFAFINGITNANFGAGTDQKTIIKSLIKTLPGVSLGNVGDFSATLKRGNAYSGNTVQLLNEITGGGFFIDNGVGHALKDNECIALEVPTITSDSGLLGTPLRQQYRIILSMVFDPRFSIGQKVMLDSSTAKNYNGFYRVQSVGHAGMISDAQCGEVVTKLTLGYGTEDLFSL